VSRTALVLSGGGLTGAVYHIGALRALNDALLDRSVNDFDIYVGTSAGAVISSCVANGIRTKDLLRAISGQAGPANLHRSDVFRPNVDEFVRKIVGLPAIAAWACWHYVKNIRDMDLIDLGTFAWTRSRRASSTPRQPLTISPKCLNSRGEPMTSESWRRTCC